MDAEMRDTEVTCGTLAALHENRLRSEGWRVQVLKHVGNDGEIVSISRRGDAKSIPVRPWVADCGKNDSRPLNMATINVLLVKTTGEAPCRAVQREYALPHKSVSVIAEGESNRIRLDIAPDHDDPSSALAASHGFGGQRARALGQLSCRVDAGSTRAWIEGRYPASR
jgi:hypothetical protein